MIETVHLRYFKGFEDQRFELRDAVVLAGPNNAGKTTLIQAIATWRFAFDKWLLEKGNSKATRRTGVVITRKEFLSVPVRELKLLWSGARTAMRKGEGKAGAPRVMSVGLAGKDANGVPWELTMEFRYTNAETLYAKPSVDVIPGNITDSIVHVPAFSGMTAEEPIHAREYQDWLVGQGRPGDILRNLLMEVHGNPGQWEKLRGEIQVLFGYTLLPPEYKGRTFILCDYLAGIAPKQGDGGFPRLDIANAGSGFLQTLMLLAFVYARPSSVLLLDEPDAHLHVVLQKQVYDQLRSTARKRNCQIVIATHSEVLIDGTDERKIISFFGVPHVLKHKTEKDGVREALKRILSMDIIHAEGGRVLYLEGVTDLPILRAWARVLGHRVHKWFIREPYYWNMGGNEDAGKAHFFALRAVYRDMKGLMLLDGDKGVASSELPHHHDKVFVYSWRRREIENYLVYPDAIERFVDRTIPLLTMEVIDKIKRELPPAVLEDPLGDHDYWKDTPVSKGLLPKLLGNIGVVKNEYYQIAEVMKPHEIHDDVKEMLDTMAEYFEVEG